MKKEIISTDKIIVSKIYFIRNQKVMLDKDLALLYDVETKYLKRQVKRNLKRFPNDFMFTLTEMELKILRSQIGTSSWGGNRYLPIAFTEQGVAMLSSVLHCDKSIEVNIKIMRLFSKMREAFTDNLNIKLEIEDIKKKLSNHSKNIELVFSYLDELIEKKERPRNKIGYKK